MFGQPRTSTSQYKSYYRDITFESFTNESSLDTSRRVWAAMIPILPEEVIGAGSAEFSMKQFKVKNISGDLKYYLLDGEGLSRRAFIGTFIVRAPIMTPEQQVSFLRDNLRECEGQFTSCWKNTKDLLFSSITSLHLDNSNGRSEKIPVTNSGMPVASNKNGIAFTDGTNLYMILQLMSDMENLVSDIDVAGSVRLMYSSTL